MRLSFLLLGLLTFVVLALSASTSSCDATTGADSYLSGSQPSSSSDYRSTAYQDAIDAGIPADLFVKQINMESGFNPYAVSPAGAIGIAQIMPSTAAGWHVDPRDPSASLKAAANAMAWYQNTYGSYDKALACYNAGCSALIKAENGCIDFYWCLPSETRNYITNITGDV